MKAAIRKISLIDLFRGFVGILALVLSGVVVSAGNGPPVSDRDAVTGTKQRVALVIGNSAYSGAAALRNAANDATDLAAKLNKLGFRVTLRTNLGLREMLRALTDFGDQVQDGTEALFFYAGHGVQVRGRNFLVPIDAEIRRESAVSSEAVDVDQLLDKLLPARLSIVILDACRNNPFERRFRGGGQGLASINAPTGTLIAYSTAPGRVASDGEGSNGLYTQELLSAIDLPGIKVEEVFKRVRVNVVRRSDNEQTPWESSSLTGDFYFVPPELGRRPGSLSENESLRRRLQVTEARASQEIEKQLRRQTELMDKLDDERRDASLKLSMIKAESAKEKALRQELESRYQELLAKQEDSAFRNRPAGITIAPSVSSKASPESKVGDRKSPLDRDDVALPPDDADISAADVTALNDAEWIYSAKDRLFGKSATINQRTRGSFQSGELIEEIGTELGQSRTWVFSGLPTVVPVQTESELMLGPNWTNRDFSKLQIPEWLRAAGKLYYVRAQSLGEEDVTVPAGRFHTMKYRLTLSIVVGGGFIGDGIDLTIWYSEKLRRVIRQHALSIAQHVSGRVDEIIELTRFGRQ